MISVTNASKFLHSPDGQDHATLVVPDRAIGAMVTVNAMLTRMTRLVRIVDDYQQKEAKARRRLEQDAKVVKPSGAPVIGLKAAGVATGSSSSHGGVIENLIEQKLLKEAFKKALPMTKMGGRVLGRTLGALSLPGLIDEMGPTMKDLQGKPSGMAGVGYYFKQLGRAFDPRNWKEGGGEDGGGGLTPDTGPGLGDKIKEKWNESTKWIGEKTDVIVTKAGDAWDEATVAFKKTSSLVGQTIADTWKSVKESFSGYQNDVGKWIVAESRSVQTWLESIMTELRSGISSVNLRQLGLQWMDDLRAWMKQLIGGGGGGGGGVASGGDAGGHTEVDHTTRGNDAGDTTLKSTPGGGVKQNAGVHISGANAEVAPFSATSIGTGSHFDTAGGIGGVSAPGSAGAGVSMGGDKTGVGTLGKSDGAAAPRMFQQGGRIGLDPTTPTAKASLPPGSDAVLESQSKVAGTRTRPIKDELHDQLNYAAAQNGVKVEVTSGGQAAIGTPGPRTGSTRHDLGGAGDLKIYTTNPDGSKHYLSMNNPAEASVMKNFVKDSVAAGATGVGAGVGYMGDKTMHIGGGKAATWGGAPWIGGAFNEGRNNPIDLQAWKKQQAEAAKGKAVPSAVSEQTHADAIGEAKSAGSKSDHSFKSFREFANPGIQGKGIAEPGPNSTGDGPKTIGIGNSDGSELGTYSNRKNKPISEHDQIIRQREKDRTEELTKQAIDGFNANQRGAAENTKAGLGMNSPIEKGTQPGTSKPETDTGPKPTTVQESSGEPAAKEAAPEQEAPAEQPSTPMTKHGKMSMDDIPTTHPDVHLAVSGHTDKY
jgi:hypothetical protein